MTIAAFNIKKATDEEGRDIEPTHEYTAGVIRCVVPISILLVDNVCFA